MPLTADQIVDLLQLEPLPGEGGFFRETYRAADQIPAGTYADRPGVRCASTQIYYLLRAGAVSALHRVRSDEVFHHYAGDAVTQLRLTPEGRSELITIGSDLESGQRPQAIVPAGWWQGACLASDSEDAWALMGCTVSPGFEWEDFELIEPETDLRLDSFPPEHRGLAQRLGVSD